MATLPNHLQTKLNGTFQGNGITSACAYDATTGKLTVTASAVGHTVKMEFCSDEELVMEGGAETPNWSTRAT